MELTHTMTLTVHGATHIGLVRARNEDAFRVDVRRGYAIVADGMGGLPGGDRASTLASQALAAFLDRFDGGVSEETLNSGMEAAQDAVLTEAWSEPQLTGMGTTLTALSVNRDSGTLTLAHVGDSRAYRLRAGELARLTRDHTVAQERVDRGVLDQYDAESHPTAHLLTQSVGSSLGIRPDLLTDSLQDGDLFVLCTDGLTKVLSDADLLALLQEREPGEEGWVSAEMEALTDAVIEASLDRGGPDNVTVVVIGVGSQP